MLSIFQKSYKPAGPGGFKKEWRCEKESEVSEN